MTSQARIDANRINAARSTGPRSQTGKDRSKMNRLTHGLRAAEVVLPTEDAGAFRAHLDAWMDDWKPPTMARQLLVERSAVAAWRLRRCVRVETARLSDRIDAALVNWDRREREAVERGVRTLFEDPQEGLQALLATRAGVARVMGMWGVILEAVLEPGGWLYNDEHHVPFLALMGLGRDDEEGRAADRASWRLLLHDRPDLDPEGVVPLDDAEAEALRAQIAQVARGRLDRLAGILDGFPDRSADRARSAELAAFAPRPEDEPLLRYEGQFDREVKRSLDHLTRLTLNGADLMAKPDPEPDAPNEPNPDGQAPAPNEPNTESEITDTTQVAPNSCSHDGPKEGVSRNKANPPGGDETPRPADRDLPGAARDLAGAPGGGSAGG